MNELTLSIVSHGQALLLARLLRDLAALPALASTPIIVTLNLVDEPFDRAAFEPLRITVLRNPTPKGFGANHNAAFEHCHTDWFVVLNPDLRLLHDPWPALLETSARWPNLALIAPRVLGAGGLPEDAARSNLTLGSVLARRVLGRRQPMHVDGPTRAGTPFYWVAGMFMMLRSSAFDAVRGFDKRFFMYCEDYDLCARLYAAGYALTVEPGATVIHDAQRDSHTALTPLLWHVSSLLKVWTSRAFWHVTVASTPSRDRST